jgi:spore coat polysaccharide biosynthesis protein SpsF
MGSTRLPGKIMLPILDKPVLEYLINRVKKSSNIDEIIIATSNNKNDDIIEKFCETRKIKCFRGSEKDVLLRYFEAAKKFSIDIIVRLTSDTPLLDPKVIDKVVSKYLDNDYDFVSNIFPLPRTYPDGYNVEVFSKNLLETINKEAKKPSDREHVTTFISMQPKKFKKYRVDSKKDFSKYRLNLDYKEDFELIKAVFEGLEEGFELKDIIYWLDNHPKILKLNSNIKPYENLLKSFEQDEELGFKPYENNFYLDQKNK